MTVDVQTLMSQAGLPTGLPRTALTARRAALPPDVQDLHRRVLLCFAATSHAPSAGELTDWATELGVELAPALSALAAAELLFLDPSGQQVTGGVPFAAGSTAHQVSIAGGPTVSANRAVDALGISTMLGRDTDIGSRDRHTSEQVTAVSRSGRWGWQPAEAVVFVGSTGASGSAADRGVLPGHQLFHRARPRRRLPGRAQPRRDRVGLGRGGLRWCPRLRRPADRRRRVLMVHPAGRLPVGAAAPPPVGRGLAEDLAVSAVVGYAATTAMELASAALYGREPERDQRREDAARPGPPYQIAAAMHYSLALSWSSLYLLSRRNTPLAPLTAGLATGAAMSLLADEAMTPLLGFSASNRAYRPASDASPRLCRSPGLRGQRRRRHRVAVGGTGPTPMSTPTPCRPGPPANPRGAVVRTQPLRTTLPQQPQRPGSQHQPGQHHPSRSQQPMTAAEGGDRPAGSGWWMGLLALLPVACCALPGLLAAGITVSTGAVVGGVVGAALLAAGAVLAVLTIRRRRRAATADDAAAGGGRGGCC